MVFGHRTLSEPGNEVQMPYLRVDEQAMVDGRSVEVRAMVYPRAAMNPINYGQGATSFGVRGLPSVAPGGSTLALTLPWVVANHLPFFPLVMLAQRISYRFYFLRRCRR